VDTVEKRNNLSGLGIEHRFLDSCASSLVAIPAALNNLLPVESSLVFAVLYKT
jgi:hypothetical protein